MMKLHRAVYPGLLVAALALAIGLWRVAAPAEAASPQQEKPALSVTAASPRQDNWPQTLDADGELAPWHEAIISAEVGGARITRVEAEVGDVVRAGQLLAALDDAPVRHELAQAEAALEQARAAQAESEELFRRASALHGSGAISDQQVALLEQQARAARARTAQARAQRDSAGLRLARTVVRAPDDGVISARIAAMGATPGVGGEMFRLLRRQRLQWRAELGGDALRQLRVGDVAHVRAPDGVQVAGQVARIAPTLDAATRLGHVYVDLPPHPALRAGMFAQGSFTLAARPALTVPARALVMRDGFSYVFELDNSRARLRKVRTGRRQDERVEIVEGLAPRAQIVAAGAGFLNDGDRVKVVAPAGAQARAW